MRYTKIFFLIVFFSLTFHTAVFAQTSPIENVGVIQDTIWFSKKDPVLGDKITLYTFVYNGSNQVLAGSVDFFDKQVLIGSKTFTLNALTGTTASVPFTVTAGEHVITAKVRDTKSGTKKTPVSIDNIRTDEKSFTILAPVTTPPPTTEKTTSSDTLSSIQEKIQEYTPEPVQHIASAIDEFREDTGTTIVEKNTAAEKKLATYQKSSPEVKQTQKVQAPFLYLWKFITALGVFIFTHSFLFYALSFLIVFFILRFLWGMSFGV